MIIIDKKTTKFIIISIFLYTLFFCNLCAQNISIPELNSPIDKETIKITVPKFKWLKVKNADYYNITIYTDVNCTEKVIEAKPYPKQTEWTVLNDYLQEGTTYYWQVAAHTSDGWSKPSNIWSFTIVSKKSSQKNSELHPAQLLAILITIIVLFLRLS